MGKIYLNGIQYSGTDGNHTLIGSTAPSSSAGVEGDFYVQTTTISSVTSVSSMFVKIDTGWIEIQTGGTSLPQA